jgi:hypothetical protein
MLIAATGTLGYRTLGGILRAIEDSSESRGLLSLFRILGLCYGCTVRKVVVPD